MDHLVEFPSLDVSQAKKFGLDSRFGPLELAVFAVGYAIDDRHGHAKL